MDMINDNQKKLTKQTSWTRLDHQTTTWKKVKNTTTLFKGMEMIYSTFENGIYSLPLKDYSE